MIYTVHIYESFIVSVWVQISMSVRGTAPAVRRAQTQTARTPAPVWKVI